MIWADKYSPKSIDELAGNSDAKEKLKVWALEWNRGNRKPPLLLYGPPGVGKSCAPRAVANANGWELLEINAAEVSDKEKLVNMLSAAGSTSSLSGARKLIFIDEADSATERGVMPAIYEAAKGALQPMIIVADDVWSQAMASLRTSCSPVELKRVNVRTVASRLNEIARAENLEANEEQLGMIAGNSGGDLRAAINDLQSLAWLDGMLASRDRGKKIYDCVRQVLKANGYQEARDAKRGLDMEPEMFARWMDENVPREYEKPEDLARAFDSLSRADVFYGRIRNRQNWSLLRYHGDLVTAGVAVAKDSPYHRFVKYDFPNYIRKMSASKSKRAKEKKVLLKIGARTHASTKRAKNALPLVKLIVKKGVGEEAVARYFGFDSEELAYFTGKKKEAAKKKA